MGPCITEFSNFLIWQNDPKPNTVLSPGTNDKN